MSRLFTVLLLLLASPAQAKMVLINFSSGSGFFVHRDGYLITNNHVIKSCSGTITVYGDNVTMAAQILARDAVHDLALLKTAFSVSDALSFNNLRTPLKISDPVYLVGYPGQSWQKHEPVTRDAKLVDTHGPMGEPGWLQISESVAFGNSGGPLLDASGHVIGVIVAKSTLHTTNMDTGEETVTKSDIAISLPIVKEFLHANHVTFAEEDSGIYLSADRVTSRTRDAIVNLRCQVPEGTKP